MHTNSKGQKKIQKKWIKALRSGKYNQVQDSLAGETDAGKPGFCCLGVLCEVMKAPYRPIAAFPSKKVLAKAGLLMQDAEKLATLNDEGMSFDAIADCIEDMLRGEDIEEY